MSHTTSRGSHTRERWRTPALAVLENFEYPQNVEIEKFPSGAFRSLEKFCDWALAGIALEEEAERKRSNQPEPSEPYRHNPNIPAAGAECALGILRGLNGTTDLQTLKYLAEVYKVSLWRIRESRRPLIMKQDHDKLREFLKQMARP